MEKILGILLLSFASLLPKADKKKEESSKDNYEESPQRVCPSCGSHNTVKNS